MNFDGHLFSHELRGNLGVRVVGTDQLSQGYSTTLLPITASRNYDNVLPSLNLVWSLRDDFLARFAASRDLSRPNLTDLAASTSVTVSGTQFNVKTGNPNIQPFLANAYDLSFEWYPAAGTMVAVAPFYKQVLRFTSTQTVNTVFNGNPYRRAQFTGHCGLRLDSGMQSECDLGLFRAGELAGRRCQRS